MQIFAALTGVYLMVVQQTLQVAVGGIALEYGKVKEARTRGTDCYPPPPPPPYRDGVRC